jgi:hypothetical protein
MTAHDRFARGNLQITGYLGQDAKAHCHHLWSFGEMFLAPLKARWDADAA